MLTPQQKTYLRSKHVLFWATGVGVAALLVTAWYYQMREFDIQRMSRMERFRLVTNAPTTPTSVSLTGLRFAPEGEFDNGWLYFASLSGVVMNFDTSNATRVELWFRPATAHSARRELLGAAQDLGNGKYMFELALPAGSRGYINMVLVSPDGTMSEWQSLAVAER